MSKIKFIRGLWGEGDKTNKVIDYMKGAEGIDAQLSSKIYVFGDDNYRALAGLGRGMEKGCGFLANAPVVYEDNCRHKLAIIEKALGEFPEVVFIDWHIGLRKELPLNFEALRKGAPIKAALRMYKKRTCMWRKDDQRKVCASDFLYVRGIRAVRELIEVWEGMEKPCTLEQVLMKYVDCLTGTWRGVDYYKEYFEIPYFSMSWEKELYGEEKKEGSFISLKDITEEVHRQKKSAEKVIVEEKVELKMPTLEVNETIPEVKRVVKELKQAVPGLEQAMPELVIAPESKPNVPYRMYPVDVDSWTSTITRR